MKKLLLLVFLFSISSAYLSAQMSSDYKYSRMRKNQFYLNQTNNKLAIVQNNISSYEEEIKKENEKIFQLQEDMKYLELLKDSIKVDDEIKTVLNQINIHKDNINIFEEEKSSYEKEKKKLLKDKKGYSNLVLGYRQSL